MPNTLIYYFSSKMEVHPKTGLTFWYSFCSFCVSDRVSESVCYGYTRCVCSVLILCILNDMIRFCLDVLKSISHFYSVWVWWLLAAVVVWKNPFDRRLNFFLWVRKPLTLRCELRAKKSNEWNHKPTPNNVDDDELNAKKKFCLEVDVTFEW